MRKAIAHNSLSCAYCHGTSQDHLGIFSIMYFTFLVLKKIDRWQNKKEYTLHLKQIAWSVLQRIGWKSRVRKYLPTQARLSNLDPLSAQSGALNHWKVPNSYLFNLQNAYRSSLIAALSCQTVTMTLKFVWNYCRKNSLKRLNLQIPVSKIQLINCFVWSLGNYLPGFRNSGSRIWLLWGEGCNGSWCCRQQTNPKIPSHTETYGPNQSNHIYLNSLLLTGLPKPKSYD